MTIGNSVRHRFRRPARARRRQASRAWTALALLPVLGWAAAPRASAQATVTDGAVSANGVATIERKPDVMRMEVDVTATGKDAREALANLKAQEKAIRPKLAALGASDASVKFGEPRVQVENVDPNQQMQRMIRARTGGGRGGKAGPATGPAAAPPVAVAMSLTVDWPLKAAAADELLVEAHELQNRVKAADVVAKPASTLTPEQQEELEEQLGGQGGGGMDGEGGPVGPLFTFVAKISPEDRAKATAEAFAKAKREAATVAAAAGTELGALRQLASSAASGTDVDQMSMYGYSNSYQRAMYARMQQQQAAGAEGNEAVASQAGKVKYQVTVAASFAIK